MRRWLRVALLVISAGVLAARLIDSPGFRSTLLACLGIAFLPGYLLVRLLGKRLALSPLEQIPIGFGFSLGLILLAGTVTFECPIPFVYLTTGLLAFAGVLAVVEVVLRTRRPERSAMTETEHWVLAAGLALAALLAWVPVFRMVDDYIYAGIVRSMQEAGRLFPAHDYFYLGAGPDPRAGLGQFALALIGTQTGYAYLELWQWLPPFFAFQMILAAYFLAKRLSNRPYFVGWALLFFGLFFRIKGFRYVASHSSMATICLLPALGCALEYVRKERSSALLLAGLLGGLAAVVHPSRMMLYLLALGCLWLAVLASREEVFKRTIRLIVLGAAALPGVVYCLVHVGDIVNPYYATWEHTDWVIPSFLGANWVFPNYHYPGIYPGHYLVAAGLIGLVCLFHRRHRTARLFLSACVAVPMLLQFNPWTFTLLCRQLSYVAAVRLVHLPMIIVPFFFAYGALETVSRWRQMRWPGRVAVLVLCLAVVGFAFPLTLGKLKGDLRRIHRPFQLLSESEKAAIDYLAKHAPPEAVVCAGERQSYAIPALTGGRIVTTKPEASTVSHADQLERMAANRTILSGASSVDNVRRAIRRFQVQYVLLPERVTDHPILALARPVSESLSLYQVNPEVHR